MSDIRFDPAEFRAWVDLVYIDFENAGAFCLVPRADAQAWYLGTLMPTAQQLQRMAEALPADTPFLIRHD